MQPLLLTTPTLEGKKGLGSKEGRGLKGGLWRHGASLVTLTVRNLPPMQETQVASLDREDGLEKRWQPTPVLPGKSHCLAGRLQSMGVTKSQTQLSCLMLLEAKPQVWTEICHVSGSLSQEFPLPEPQFPHL